LVTPTSPESMGVNVSLGLGYQDDPSDVPSGIGGVSGLDDLSEFKPLYLTSVQTLTVPGADPTNPRVDIVEVKFNRDLGNPLSRDVLNIVTGQFVPTIVQKTLSFCLDGLTSVNGSQPINYKTGTPAGSPTPPAVDAGYIKIAEIRVEALSTTVPATKITDFRSVLFPAVVQDLAEPILGGRPRVMSNDGTSLNIAQFTARFGNQVKRTAGALIGFSGLSIGQWYYVYAYNSFDKANFDSGVSYEVSTLGPSNDLIYKGGDNTRLYLCSVFATSATSVRPFCFSNGSYTWRISAMVCTAVLAGGTTTSFTNVNLLDWIAPHCSMAMLDIFYTNPALSEGSFALRTNGDSLDAYSANYVNTSSGTTSDYVWPVRIEADSSSNKVIQYKITVVGGTPSLSLLMTGFLEP